MGRLQDVPVGEERSELPDAGEVVPLAALAGARVVSSTGGRVTLALHGELDVAAAPRLRALLRAFREQGHDVFVLHVGAVTFIDAAALGVLAGARLALQREGGRLVVVGARPGLRRVLTLTGLERVLATGGAFPAPA